MAKNPSIYYYTCAIRHKFFHAKKRRPARKQITKDGQVRYGGMIKLSSGMKEHISYKFLSQICRLISQDFYFEKNNIHSILEHQPPFSFALAIHDERTSHVVWGLLLNNFFWSLFHYKQIQRRSIGYMHIFLQYRAFLIHAYLHYFLLRQFFNFIVHCSSCSWCRAAVSHSKNDR